MERKFWGDFDTGRYPQFPNQKELWSRVSADGHNEWLGLTELVPLTMLLILCKSSLEAAEGYVRSVNQSWTDFSTKVAEGSELSIKTEWLSTAAAVQAHSVYYDEPQTGLQKVPDEAIFYPIKILGPIYCFFHLYCSILDRLTHELVPFFKRLQSEYSSLSSNWGWGKLFDGDTGAVKKKIGMDMACVSSDLEKHNLLIRRTKTRKYRHVFTHKGFLRTLCQPDISQVSWKVMLPLDPDKDDGEYQSMDAIQFMTDEFSTLIKFLDSVYAGIVTQFESSKPPW
ncbi:MAG: hypothetical protein KKG33_14030 [candidate division Zixibacteria bacterium]|nr:hypothetical protein [candidate division Zixibacteria bacterium]